MSTLLANAVESVASTAVETAWLPRAKAQEVPSISSARLRHLACPWAMPRLVLTSCLNRAQLRGIWERHAPAWLPEPGWSPAIPGGSNEHNSAVEARGLTNHLACSDIAAPYARANLTREHDDALAQAHLAHKKPCVTAIHAHIANARKDWAHKTTTAIGQRARLRVVGHVSISQLSQTRMAPSVYDAGWRQLRTRLASKALQLGVTYRAVKESWSRVTCAVWPLDGETQRASKCRLALRQA